MTPNQERARRRELRSLSRKDLVKLVMKFDGHEKWEIEQYTTDLMLDLVIAYERRHVS